MANGDCISRRHPSKRGRAAASDETLSSHRGVTRAGETTDRPASTAAPRRAADDAASQIPLPTLANSRACLVRLADGDARGLVVRVAAWREGDAPVQRRAVDGCAA